MIKEAILKELREDQEFRENIKRELEREEE